MDALNQYIVIHNDQHAQWTNNVNIYRSSDNDRSLSDAAWNTLLWLGGGYFIWSCIVNTKTFEETFNDLINNHCSSIKTESSNSNNRQILENLEKLGKNNGVLRDTTSSCDENHIEYEFKKVNPLTRIGATAIDLSIVGIMSKIKFGPLNCLPVQSLALIILSMSIFGSQTIGMKLFDITMVSTKRDIYKPINDGGDNKQFVHVYNRSKGMFWYSQQAHHL